MDDRLTYIRPWLSLVVGTILLVTGAYFFRQGLPWVLGLLWTLLGLNRLLFAGRWLLPGGQRSLEGWLLLSGMALIVAAVAVGIWFFVRYIW